MNSVKQCVNSVQQCVNSVLQCVNSVLVPPKSETVQEKKKKVKRKTQTWVSAVSKRPPYLLKKLVEIQDSKVYIEKLLQHI